MNAEKVQVPQNLNKLTSVVFILFSFLGFSLSVCLLSGASVT